MEETHLHKIVALFSTGYYSGTISGVIVTGEGKAFLFDTIDDTFFDQGDRRFAICELAETDFQRFLCSASVDVVRSLKPFCCWISADSAEQRAVHAENRWQYEGRMEGAYTDLEILGACEVSQEELTGKWGTSFMDTGYA